MNQIRYIFQKLLSFLRVRAVAGGLEISDQVLRLVYFNGKTWQMAAIRLEPGVMEAGKIKKADALREALHTLKLKITGARGKKKMNVVVAFSSVSIYSQTFALPLIEGDDLEKAIRLNVQMMSPVDASQVYSGWQLIGRDEVALKIEVAAAFIDKTIVDEMTQLLLQAEFIPICVESRPLALMRIVKEKGSGIDVERAYLLVDIDNSGLDFLIVRKGNLYFEYANRWEDLADEKGQVSVEKFEDALAASVRQVMNFYQQHWPEPMAAVILSAVAFDEAAERAITKAAGLPIVKLTLVMGQPVSSEWLVALGSSLRGFRSAARGNEINLLGEGTENNFRREQLLSFLNLWRVLVPVALGLLVLTFFLANNFLESTAAGIESQSAFTLGAAQEQEIAGLQASSTAFNNLVGMAAAVEGMQHPKYGIIKDITDLAATNGVTVDHISYPGGGAPVAVAGTAAGNDHIIAFKAAIEADPRFGTVTLPLTAIQQNGTSFSFSMTFPAQP